MDIKKYDNWMQQRFLHIVYEAYHNVSPYLSL